MLTSVIALLMLTAAYQPAETEPPAQTMEPAETAVDPMNPAEMVDPSPYVDPETIEPAPGEAPDFVPTPAPEQAPEFVPTPSPQSDPTPTPTPEPTETANGGNTDDDDGELICRRKVVSGDRMGERNKMRRICKTREEWAEPRGRR